MRDATLTEELIFSLAPDVKSTKAAKEVAASNAFREPRVSPDGRWLAALAKGSMREPYRVIAELTDEARFRCTCGSMKYPCKHALALLFLLMQHRDRFRVDPSLGGAPLSAESIPLKAPTTGPTEAPADEGEALMQAIFNEPDEVAHRLVYADWIDERGDAARAEFIRVQCEIERGASGPRLDQLRKRERELLAKHRTKWLADVPKHLRGKVRLRGGFVSALEDIPAKALLKYGPDLFARYPIWAVRLGLEADEKTISQLAVEPFWARVRSLTMWTTVRMVEMLLSSVFLKHVRHFDLGSTDMGSRGCKALAAWPGLKNLQSLGLISTEVTDGAAAALSGGDLGGLRHLGLQHNRIGNAGAEALASCAALAGLRNLNLSGNDIGPKGVKALASSPHLAALRVLDLGTNPITDKGAKALAESPHLGGLERLVLIDIELGEKTKEALRQRFGNRVSFVR